MNNISGRTREILASHGLTLKKKYGQNFLTDQHILNSIVRVAELTSSSGVLEIGPGIGSLTEKLLEVAGKVVAIEIDDDLIKVLRQLFQGQEKVEIVYGDILKVNLPELIETHFAGMDTIHVVANLPYYITSPILIRLLEEKYPFQNMVMMMQKEVAERLTAKPGTKEYGSITVFVNYFAQVREAIKVPSTVFLPRPKVDSSVVVFDIRKEPAVQVSNEALFFRVIRAAFAQRRKTLLNTLHAHLSVDKEQLKTCLNQIGIDPTRRGETLSIEEFSLLTSAIGAIL